MMSYSVENDEGLSPCPSIESHLGSSSCSRKASKGGRGVLKRIYFRFWGRKEKTVQQTDLDGENLPGLRRFSYKELLRATANFGQERRLGGTVYKGTVKIDEDPNRVVAIKEFATKSAWSGGEKEFISEIMLLSRLRHDNLVGILGWCCENGHFLIVYEFMPNGSLDHHLSSDSIFLPWDLRYSRIIQGVARAMLYLQEEWEVCVVHRDIKPANVLLDNDFNPKLTDFEFARSGGEDCARPTSIVVGTRGYLAPEYFLTGKYGKESDIYAFGVVALEVACGRRMWNKRTDMLNWLWELFRKGEILKAADQRLQDEFDQREMERLLLLGLWCTQYEPRSRPSIDLILKLLNVETPIPSSADTIFRQQKKNEISRPFTQTAIPHDSSFMGDDESETIIFDVRRSRKTGSDLSTCWSNCVDPGGSLSDSCAETVRGTGREQEQEPDAVGAEAFDIGIPHGFDLAGAGVVGDHHRPIINGFVAGLHAILQSKRKPLEFEEVLESIKKYTGCLVTVGAPLADWNSLAQLVLRAVKESPALVCYWESEATIDGVQSSLLAVIEECTQAVDEDVADLQRVYQKLRVAQDNHDFLMDKLADLQKQIKEAEEVCLAMEEEVRLVDERSAHHQRILDRKKRQLASIKLSRSLQSEIKSFTC